MWELHWNIQFNVLDKNTDGYLQNFVNTSMTTQLTGSKTENIFSPQSYSGYLQFITNYMYLVVKFARS